KLARFHLKDMVSGRALTWPKESVLAAKLSGEVTDVTREYVLVRYDGSVDMKQEGTWGGATNTITVRRAFQPQLLGFGKFNLTNQTFISFDLIAMGVRSGTGPFNMRWKT